MINFFTPMNLYPNDNFSPQLWIFITLMNFHHSEEFVWLQSWTLPRCLILITMMNFHPKVDFYHRMNFYHNDRFASQWWIFIKNIYIIIIWNIHPWMNFIPMTNDEFSLGIFIIMMNLNHNDKLSSQLEFLTQYWISIT